MLICKQVGDAGGLQSPLSFGGFAALSRHLTRLRSGILDAVQCDTLDKYSLTMINAYSPALSGAWMMQRAMSIPTSLTSYNVNFVNKLLGGNFEVMSQLGDATLKPFLQDVIQAGPLTQTLVKQMTGDPLFVPQIFFRVGLGPLGDWMIHYLGLITFTGLVKIVDKWELESKVEKFPPRQRFLLKRAMENWRYGAGLDYQQE